MNGKNALFFHSFLLLITRNARLFLKKVRFDTPPVITKTELFFLGELKYERTINVMAIPIEEIINRVIKTYRGKISVEHSTRFMLLSLSNFMFYAMFCQAGMY